MVVPNGRMPERRVVWDGQSYPGATTAAGDSVVYASSSGAATISVGTSVVGSFGMDRLPVFALRP